MAAPISNPATNIALQLPNTTDGAAWLRQFQPDDIETATRLLGALTLVSHTAFERALQSLIVARSNEVDGPVALYATRELPADTDYFAQMVDPTKPMASLDAVGDGADLGSEARIAAIIRNLCKAMPTKLLNHPSLEMLRAKRAKAIFTIDDIIGSGKRTASFIKSMWRSPSVRSWHSRKHTRFVAIAFTATQMGLSCLSRLKSRPEVIIVRDCPTMGDLPWREETREAIWKLCDRYGRQTSRPSMRYGFKKNMAALVFEHGCPNNTPSILWAPQSEKSAWQSLFPDRTVLPTSASAFPQDILARDPIEILKSVAEEEEFEVPPAILGDAPLGITAVSVLALVAAGVRSRTALSYVTGYDARDCAALLDRCVARGYLTATLRLTAAGRAELKKRPLPSGRVKAVPPRGEDSYYPLQLRGLP